MASESRTAIAVRPLFPMESMESGFRGTVSSRGRRYSSAAEPLSSVTSACSQNKQEVSYTGT